MKSDPELKVFADDRGSSIDSEEKNHQIKNSGTCMEPQTIKSSVSTSTSMNNNNSSNNNNVINAKKGPGPGIDLSTMRKEVFHPKEVR